MIYIIIFVIFLIIVCLISIRSKVESYYFYPEVGPNHNNVLETVIGNHRAILHTKKTISVDDDNNYVATNKALIIAHGNGGNIYNRSDLIETIGTMYDGDIYCFEYPGYGACDGNVSIKSCITECQWWINHLSDKYRYLDLYGESIGGGIIMQTYKILAPNIQRKIGTIYLQSSFSSIYHVVKDINKYIAFFYKILWKNDLDSLSVLQDQTCKNKRFVFIHSPDDEIISYDQAYKNYRACCSENKYFFETSGSHNYTELSQEMFSHYK